MPHVAEHMIRQNVHAENMWYCEGEDLKQGGIIYFEPENQICQRRYHEDKPCQAEKPEETRVEIRELLIELELLKKQGVFEDKKLSHALGPAGSLRNKIVKRLWRKAAHHGFGDVNAFVSPAMQSQGGFRIFRDSVAGKASNFCKMFATQDARRAAEKGRVPEIKSHLNRSVKHLILTGIFQESAQVSFNRVWIDEKVWRLDQEKILILHEESNKILKDVSGGNMVAVKYENQVTAAFPKSRVQAWVIVR